MRSLLFLSLFLVAQITLAQTPERTQFYFYNDNVGDYKLRLQVNPNEISTLTVAFRRYTLIETDADSLSLISDAETHRLPYEKGMTYHFILQWVSGGFSPTITEVSERVFWLKVNFGKAKKPQKYFLSKTGDVQQI